jgi:ATP-dependent helicase/nuclease subunit B
LLLDRDPGRFGSRFYAFYLKENGPYGRLEESAAYTPEEYKCLLRHTHHQIVSLAQRILKGEIEICPYRMGTETPCDFCDYRSLCKFDWQINTYRSLARLDRSQILDRLGEDHG